jgi:hypothetical protein
MQESEFWSIIAVLFVMTFVLGFGEFTLLAFLYAFIISLLLILSFTITQKIVANQLGLDIKFKLWTFRRYWIRWQDQFSWDFPIWFVLPLLLMVLSDGFLRWTALLTFVTRTTAKKAVQKFSEIKEFDLALVASSGVFAVLVLALILKLFGLNDFASIASWFALLNMLPLGNLGGTKILFGSKLLWVFLLVLSIIILLLINLTQIFATIFIALILAAVAVVIFYHYYERKT